MGNLLLMGWTELIMLCVFIQRGTNTFSFVSPPAVPSMHLKYFHLLEGHSLPQRSYIERNISFIYTLSFILKTTNKTWILLLFLVVYLSMCFSQYVLYYLFLTEKMQNSFVLYCKCYQMHCNTIIIFAKWHLL